MYESYFGLNRRPFPVAPTTSLYFPSQAMEHARGTLARVIERAEGPALVAGPAGSGKSLLLQALAEQFEDRFQIALLASTRLCTRRALLQAVLYSLGLPYREREEGELRLSLIDFLSGNDVRGDAVVLLIDEAHGLPLRLLEEIRVITNLSRDGEPRVRLVLAGLHSLEERLANPRLESFGQRLAARCYLGAFSPDETGQYVRAQIAAARGNDRSIFDGDALAAIHRATEGTPRLINQLCDHALVLAYAGGVREIDAAGIEEAWADLQQLPVPMRSKTLPFGGGEAAMSEEMVEFGSLDEEDDLTPRQVAGERRHQNFEPEMESGDDDLAEAIPFPRRADTASPVDEQLARISEQLAGLDEDFQPAGAIRPEVELVFDMSDAFGDEFAEEEVVFDRYASLDERYLRSRPHVVNHAKDRISDLVSQQGDRSMPIDATPPRKTPHPVRREAPAQQESARTIVQPEYDPVLPEEEELPARNERAARSSETRDVDDRDLIIVEDELIAAPQVRRQEYRQLFARLRRSS